MELNQLLTAAQIGKLQRITATRVNQIARDMGIRPALIIGKNNLYSLEQAKTIKARNKKPGPKGKSK